MPKSKVTQIGDPVLRKRAPRITFPLGPADKKLIAKMIRVMRETELVGIAAPQIGVSKRVFVSEIRKTSLRKNLREEDAVRVFVNPTLSTQSKKQTELIEGCGSLGEASLFGPVKRPHAVTITAFDVHGKKFTLNATGLLAKVVQHELDHLNGILIIDKFVDTKKVMSRAALQNKKR